jgi:murein L,D-transpeptidase YcbB/YkuD
MKKIILEEIENMKYLLGYKRGVVISEQEEKNDMIDKYSSKSISNSIDSGNYGNLDPAAADAIKKAQNALGGQSVLTNPTTGAPTTGAPAAGAQAAGAQAAGATTPPTSTAPVTPIKIGVKYPDIETLQNLLKTKFQAVLTPDGKYGPKTAASVLAALQKAQTNTPETNTPPNIVVGGDPNAEAIKKAAEANAPNNVAANNTNNNTNKETQQPAGGTNFTDVDVSEFS